MFQGTHILTMIFMCTYTVKIENMHLQHRMCACSSYFVPPSLPNLGSTIGQIGGTIPSTECIIVHICSCLQGFLELPSHLGCISHNCLAGIRMLHGLLLPSFAPLTHIWPKTSCAKVSRLDSRFITSKFSQLVL